MPTPVSLTDRTANHPGLASGWLRASLSLRRATDDWMVRRPPPGMASRALTHRFISTCWIWPTSISTVGRLSFRRVSMAMDLSRVPARIFSDSEMTLFRLEGRMSYLPPRAKASSWAVSSAARLALFSMVSTGRKKGWSRLMLVFSQEA